MKFKSYDIQNFKRGWFVGDFSPTVFRTQDVEVAVKNYSQGEYEPFHHHKVATEFTVILNGKVEMCGEVFGPNTIIEVRPGQSTDFKALTAVTTVVVKLPGARNDKFVD